MTTETRSSRGGGGVRGDELRPVDVAFNALCEVGRRDLALMIMWFDEGDSGYLEVNDDILSEDEWKLVNKAEALACQAFGLACPDRADA